MEKVNKKYYVHPTAIIEEDVSVDEGTRIWHFVHVRRGARIGRNCNIGKGVYIDEGVRIGNNVKIQNCAGTGVFFDQNAINNKLFETEVLEMTAERRLLARREN